MHLSPVCMLSVMISMWNGISCQYYYDRVNTLDYSSIPSSTVITDINAQPSINNIPVNMWTVEYSGNIMRLSQQVDKTGLLSTSISIYYRFCALASPTCNITYSLHIDNTDYFIVMTALDNAIARVQMIGTNSVGTNFKKVDQSSIPLSTAMMVDMLPSGGGVQVIAPTGNSCLHIWDRVFMSITTTLPFPYKIQGVSTPRPSLGVMYNDSVLWSFDPSILPTFTPARAIIIDFVISSYKRVVVSKTLDYLFFSEINSITVLKLSSLSVVYRSLPQISNPYLQGYCDTIMCYLLMGGDAYPKVQTMIGNIDILQPGWQLTAPSWMDTSKVVVGIFFNNSNYLAMSNDQQPMIYFYQMNYCHTECVTCTGPLRTDCTSCSAMFTLLAGSCCHSSCETCSGQQSNQCTSCPASIYLQSDNTCSSTCNTLLGNYSLVDMGVLKCLPCLPQCASCSGSNSYCTACITGYLFTLTNDCVQCNLPTQYRYMLNNLQYCGNCDPSCTSCSDTPTNCSMCALNYYPQSSLPGSCMQTVMASLSYEIGDNSTWASSQCSIPGRYLY